jgi:hypothetical protein
MREWIDDFGRFLKAVIWRWFNLFAGVFVSAVWTIYQQIAGKSLPMSVFWWLVGLCLFWSVFSAWREQHTAHIANPIHQRRILNSLSHYGDELRGKLMADYLPPWRLKILLWNAERWEKSAIRFLEGHCNIKQYDAFLATQPTPGDIFRTEYRKLTIEGSEVAATTSLRILTTVRALQSLAEQLTKTGSLMRP